MALIKVANCTRKGFRFPTKIRAEGVGSKTVDFIDGTEDWVDESRLDEQGRLVR